jgi:predicted Rossmann fold nucleotide-binding protein DprA/Smf involved in DNA uptake
MLLRAPTVRKWRDWKLWYHGDISLLDSQLNALFCSRACPGEKIIKAIDLAQRWRAENRAVISGFHTPVEKECLRIFLRGPQRIVICPARGLDPFQLPGDWESKFKGGELLIVTPLDSSIRRPTKETAEIRTRLVLSLAQSKTIIHASPGGFLSRLITSDQLSQSVAVSKA